MDTGLCIFAGLLQFIYCIKSRNNKEIICAICMQMRNSQEKLQKSYHAPLRLLRRKIFCVKKDDNFPKVFIMQSYCAILLEVVK